MLGEQFRNTYHMDASGNPVFYTDPQSSPDIHPRKKARYQELLEKHAAGVSAGADVNTALSPDENVELNNLHVDLHRPVVSPKPIKGVEYGGLLFSPETATGDSNDPLYSEEDKRALAEKTIDQVSTNPQTTTDPDKLHGTVIDALSRVHPRILQKTKLHLDELRAAPNVKAQISATPEQATRELGLEPAAVKNKKRIAADTALRRAVTSKKGILPDSTLTRSKIYTGYKNALNNPTLEDNTAVLYWDPNTKVQETPKPRITDPAMGTLYHELGHHIDPRVDAVHTRLKTNSEGKSSVNITREAYADGFRDRETRPLYPEVHDPSIPTSIRVSNVGYTPEHSSFQGRRASQALYVAVRHHVALGHSLPHFSEFQPSVPVRDTRNDEDFLLGHLYTHHQHVRDALKHFGLDDVGAALAAKYAKAHTDAAASPKWEQQEFDLNG